MWQRHSERNAPSYVVLAAENRETALWEECAFDLDNARRNLAIFLEQHHRRKWNLYWCPSAFAHPKRTRGNALSTPFAWCDVDGSEWRQLTPEPNVVWTISPTQRQALWIWHKPQSPGQAEAYSRVLAHRFGSDRNAWYIIQLLRIPHTYSMTPDDERHEIVVIWFNDYYQRKRPKMHGGKARPKSRTSPPRFGNPFKHGRYSVVEEYKDRLSRAGYNIIRHRSVISYNRSRTIARIIRELDDAGASVNEIAAVVWRSPYFLSKYGARLDRLKAVLKRNLRT
jgi:hypothetical protein